MSTNKEMKLILESWRGFVDKNNNDDLGNIYLFEGKRKNPVEKSFQLVLEDYDNGKYDQTGTFTLKAFTRPIPGKLKLSDKATSGGDEKEIKYHPKLFS